MMGHVGYSRLGLEAFGDVDDGNEIAVAPVEGNPATEGEHLNLAAVGLDVAPVAGRLVGLPDVQQRFLVRDPLVLGPDLIELHGKELRAAIAIMLDRRI